MSWLTHDQYGAALDMLAALRVNGLPFCTRFDVATTQERRIVHGLRIHRGRRGAKAPRAVLIVGGAHAREMAPPEAVLLFATAVCHSYVNGTDLSFGGKTYPAAVAQWLVEALELFVVPLLNPDGRAWVESTDQWWRKNRRFGTCRGVDINRNYDFLFTSGLGTSNDPCDYQIYRGPGAASEPEVRGIRDLLDAHYNIRGVLDVHAYTGLILYPWGDDQNQSTDPAMNFRNSAWDGQRGFRNDTYREHMVNKDLLFFQRTAKRMQDRVKEVANRNYTTQQGFDLYPISANLKDYPYSRHLASPPRSKILSMAVEIGYAADGGFRPAPDAVAQIVRQEGAVLIVEYCLAIVCVGDAVLSSAAAAATMAGEFRVMRDTLQESRTGAQYVDWLEALSGEVLPRLADPAVLRDVPAVLKKVRAWWRAGTRPLDEDTAARTARLLRTLRRRASLELRTAIDAATADVERLVGVTAAEAPEKLRGGGRKQQRR